MAVNTMETLVKLHKRRVDVLRREMLALEDERLQLLQLSEKLAKEHEQEMKLAAEDPRMAGFFGAYSRRHKERQAAIAKEAARLQGAIEEKAEAVREEFSEQKKFEIVRENAKKKELAKARALQQQRFDEIGSQQYLRAREHTT